MREQYSEAKAGPKLGVTFEDEEIALRVPREGFTVHDHWTITPLAHPGVSIGGQCSLLQYTVHKIMCTVFCLMQIAKEDVDSFKPGLQLPSCQLELKWNGRNKPGDLTYMVELQGAKKPKNFFHILLRHEFIQAGVY